jgi:hypothetical protein
MSDEAGKVTRYFAIDWLGAPCFWWYRDQIFCKNPTEEQIRKLAEIAPTLRAWVIGDDGESYHVENGQLILRPALVPREKKPMHPAVRALVLFLFATFFVGGLLIFVNNLIVKFLPEAFVAIFGGILLIMIIVMVVVAKCLSAVKVVRKIFPGPDPPTRDAG